jgi:hypothetical protein
MFGDCKNQVFGAMAAFIAGESIVLSRESVFDAEVGMECIRPEFDIKAGTMEYGTKCIADHLVGLFNGSVLV